MDLLAHAVSSFAWHPVAALRRELLPDRRALRIV
jgi:hypothetical protein